MSAREGGRRRTRNLTLIGLCSVGVASPLQQSLVIPSLPGLARDLHASTGWTTWILTLYLLSAAVAAPLAGRLGDQFGKKRLLVISTAVMFAAAIGATCAWDIWSLIVFRGIGGLGGVSLTLSISIARDEFAGLRLPQAIGLVSGFFGLGAAAGNLISGLVINQVSWRWLFAIGAVAIGVACAAVARLVPESPNRATSRLDLPGAALFGGGMLCLLLALTEGQSWGPTSARILGLVACAVALLIVWVRVEARAPAPMIDVRLLTHRPVLLTNLVTLLNGFVIFGIFVLVPHLIEAPRGLGAEASRLVDYGFGSSRVGFYLVPAAFIQFVAGPLGGILGARVGSKAPLLLGLALEACGAGALALWHDTPAAVIGELVVIGLGFGLAAAAGSRLISDEVESTAMGVLTGMNSLMLLLGGVVAGQLVAALLAADTVGGSRVPAESAFVSGFWTVAAIAAGGMAFSFLIRRQRQPAGVR